MEVKGVKLTIQNDPKFVELGGDGTSFTTRACFIVQDEEGCFDLLYNDGKWLEMNDVYANLKVRPGVVLLSHSGEADSDIVFQVGHPCTATFDTELGEILTTVYTSRVESSLTPDGGEVVLQYALEIEHTLAARNAMHFYVEVLDPKKQDGC